MILLYSKIPFGYCILCQTHKGLSLYNFFKKFGSRQILHIIRFPGTQIFKGGLAQASNDPHSSRMPHFSKIWPYKCQIYNLKTLSLVLSCTRLCGKKKLNLSLSSMTYILNEYAFFVNADIAVYICMNIPYSS